MGAYVSQKHSVTVNVFKKTCDVPGINLEGERWQKEGQTIPWHLTIRTEDVHSCEMELRKLGHKPGHGFFTWFSDSNGVWGQNENRDTSVTLSYVKNLASIHEANAWALKDVLGDLTSSDDPALVKTLLEAKVNPNHNYEGYICSSPLHGACMYGKIECAKLLIESRADVTLKNKRHETALQMGGGKARLVRSDLQEFHKEWHAVEKSKLIEHCVDAILHDEQTRQAIKDIVQAEIMSK